jgi:hypothetical protein
MPQEIPMCAGRQHDDGTIELVFRLTREQMAEFESDMADVESQLESSPDRRKDYCCDCNNGFRHTIRASHALSAAWKCFRKCGAFQMSRGKCR